MRPFCINFCYYKIETLFICHQTSCCWTKVKNHLHTYLCFFLLFKLSNIYYSIKALFFMCFNFREHQLSAVCLFHTGSNRSNEQSSLKCSGLIISPFCFFDVHSFPALTLIYYSKNLQEKKTWIVSNYQVKKL